MLEITNPSPASLENNRSPLVQDIPFLSHRPPTPRISVDIFYQTPLEIRFHQIFI